MLINEDAYLMHYGILRKSGRYPWGSGGNVEQRSRSFIDTVKRLLGMGLTEPEIARGFGMTTTELRAARTIANNAAKQADIAMAQRLKDKGYSNVAIGERMGIPESSVRNLLAPGAKDKADILTTTANMLRDQVDAKGVIDIGSGVENHIGLSKEKLNVAVAMLKDEGYKVHYINISTGAGQFTKTKVLAREDESWSDIVRNPDKIKLITDFSEDGGRSYLGLREPLSIDSKRVGIRYAEDGGTDSDGVIYVRPGVKDISIGNSRYAQVRIAVDGTHYLKGMAVYRDDMPDGVDLLFNTNKKNTGNKLDAMKAMKDDPDNPFGAVVRQRIELDADGKERVTSVMNIVGSKEGAGEEGSWDTWSRNLPSQFLSKQSPSLARTQLNMTYENKRAEFDEIMALTNPTVRKHLLEKFADGVDSSSVHLKAAAMPRQATQVLLPHPSLKDTEIYAPNFRNGETVALVRFPHGGTFEIPELTVNNNHPSAKRSLGNITDAVAINPRVAERLSGADFDGDAVLVIPNNAGKIKSTRALEGLKNFDSKTAYPAYEGMKPMDARTKGIQMGVVSNLITDMTIRGASPNELAAAVRHSMVVIDAEKHNLNWRQSAIDNGIANLKEKYQGGANSGASTLISRANAEVRVADRKPRSAAKGGAIDKATGRRVYEETGDSYVDKKGRVVQRTIRSKRLAETDDASHLSSGTPIEAIYASHSNRLKDMANEARKVAVNTKTIPYSPSAKTAYSKEVASLNAKLNVAIRNRPLERQAQAIANSVVTTKRQANPDMDKADVKKIKNQALNEARNRVGAKSQKIDITPSEWNAIQAGAISNHKLEQILNKADIDVVRNLATPRTNLVMTSTKQKRAQAMLNSGYTQAEVADALGIALSTLKSSLES